MAHSAEDLTSIVFEEMGYDPPTIHSDVRRGFVVEFPNQLDIDLDEVERRVLAYIDQDVPICYHDESHILIGGVELFCTGPRLHMRSAGEIANFRLEKRFQYSPLTQTYLLAGRVGKE